MADPRGPDAGGETGPDPGGAPPAGMPRWVKVFAIIGIALALLIGILLVTGHGPGRHGPSLQGPAGESGERQTPSPGGHEPPEGAHG